MRMLRCGTFLFVVFLVVARLCADDSAGKAAAASYLVDAARLAQLEAETGERSVDALLEQALAYDERRDTARAAEYYRRAAALGAGPAELRLGALYETGEGVPQSYEEARTHYLRATSLNVPEANLRLGMLYLEGWGVPADVAAAVAHIERAAEAGYNPAQRILSEMYFAGVKVARDPKKALAWAERAATTHDAESQLRVGAIYQAAVRLPQDLRLVREWYQLSAEQDYTRGMFAMASTFFRPGADPENRAIGLRWLDLAAEGGNSAAAFYRAGIYLIPGTAGVTAGDEARARTLLETAAQKGEFAATEVLELEKSGRSLADAFHYVMTVPFDDRYVQRLAAMTNRGSAAGDVHPLPLKVVRPVYPTALRLTNTEGDVVVEFVVDTTGHVRDAHVISSTHPGFAEFGAVTVTSWRFQPGLKNGHPVNTRMRVPIYFRMSDVGDAGGARSESR